MALSDPFSTVYEGRRQAGMALGQGIQQFASAIAESQKQKQEQNLKKSELLTTLASKGIYPEGIGETFNLEGIGTFKKKKAFNFQELMDVLNKNQNANNALGVTGATLDPETGEAKLTFGETPESKQVREVKTAQEKKVIEVTAESQAVDNMISAVWNAADRLVPAPEDVGEAERLGWKRGASTANIFGIRPQRAFGISDESALGFEQIKKAQATPLIRALGEKGMLTNQDIQRAYNMMPTFGDSKILRNTKKEEMTKFLKSRISAYSQKGGIASLNVDENLVQRYMKKYPDRSKEEIISAIQRTK